MMSLHPMMTRSRTAKLPVTVAPPRPPIKTTTLFTQHRMTLRIANADCLEAMKELPDKSIDLILCDLPYGCLASGTTGTVGCAWDVKIDLADFWLQVKRIRRNDSTPTIHFCTTKFGYDLIKSNESEFRHDIVWDKEHGVSFLLANKMPMRAHEMIYVFAKKGAFYSRKDYVGEFATFSRQKREQPVGAVYGGVIRTHSGNDGTTRCVTSVVRMTKSKTRNDCHPTEKPLELYRWLIERYCPPGGTVLDPTFGSGNSLIAAMDLGRSAVGMEMNKGFFDRFVARTTLADPPPTKDDSPSPPQQKKKDGSPC